MKYSFDTRYIRRGTNSYKWDTPKTDDVLPMWVADMDFKTAPDIIDVLRRRVEEGIFGYTFVPDEYYESVIKWFEIRHNVEFRKDWFIYTSGVVPALSAIIKALTEPGDKVVTMTPAYNCFFSSIRNNGCELVSNILIRTANSYEIDFESLKQQTADPRVKILLLCNPHNPSGRVWTTDELKKVGDICRENNVVVVSDEIHCELTFGAYKYTSYYSLGEQYALKSVICNSPSKAFNIAGLQIANIISCDPEMRRRIDKAINVNEVCDVNPFGVIATIAAYNKGGDWLEALKEYIWGNYKVFCNELAVVAPELNVINLEGTYLAWIDIMSTGQSSQEFVDGLIAREMLMLNPGSMYGDGGEGYVRINLATTRDLVVDAAARIGRYVKRE